MRGVIVIYQEERLFRILDYLEQHQSMALNDICRLFQVSRDTARRDIVKLTEKGVVVRTHGGIALPLFLHKVQKYTMRQQNELEAKTRIGKFAVNLVKENELIFLDVSTTVECMIPALNVEATTVVTNSIDNAWLLMEKENIETHLLGGVLKSESRHLEGYSTFEKLKDYRFDTVFLGAAGITDEGIYYCDEPDIYFKRELIKRGERAVILADHTKFGRYSSFKGLDFRFIHTIITDKPPHKELLTTMEHEGVNLIILQE